MVATVSFRYHMWSAVLPVSQTMGSLSLVTAEGAASGAAAWSLSGNQGNSWQGASVTVYSASFAFRYVRGGSYICPLR